MVCTRPWGGSGEKQQSYYDTKEAYQQNTHSYFASKGPDYNSETGEWGHLFEEARHSDLFQYNAGLHTGDVSQSEVNSGLLGSSEGGYTLSGRDYIESIFISSSAQDEFMHLQQDMQQHSYIFNGGRITPDYSFEAGAIGSIAMKGVTALAGKFFGVASNTGAKGITVIGETQARVEAAASQVSNANTLKMPLFNGTKDQITSQMMQYNRQWLLGQIRSGRTILDIGLDVNRGTPSIFYRMEQNMLKNYMKIHPEWNGVIKP